MSRAALSPNATAVLAYALANTRLNAEGLVCVLWAWPRVREACGLPAYDDADRYGDKAYCEVLRPAIDELRAAGFLADHYEGQFGHTATVVCG